MNIKIGARIKELRKLQNVTKEKLAEALGVTNQAISRSESETGYPDIEYIIPIANFFKVTANYLLDDGSNEKLLKMEIGEENGSNSQIKCSFCGKSKSQVKKLLVGPEKISICND
ncbi:helix-turn-helix domain-containing protein [Candidatus Clostridium stratigraminis]|uniref:Helix-turn-helix domain-containing protein n=1 Tax=Candidatus Clostridium stratigraminis TaxID=3381661 RepID=A0ABW8T4F4_9CLOT